MGCLGAGCRVLGPRWPAPPRPRGRAVAASADSFGATDQSWLKDVPEQHGRARPEQGRGIYFQWGRRSRAGSSRRGAARFASKRLSVTATLRPADSPAHYRAMSCFSDLAVYIDGEISGDGDRRTAVIRLRSGVTGQYFTSARFSGSMQAIIWSDRAALWNRVGSAIMRTVLPSASRPRRQESAPTYIEQGSPLGRANRLVAAAYAREREDLRRYVRGGYLGFDIQLVGSYLVLKSIQDHPRSEQISVNPMVDSISKGVRKVKLVGFVVAFCLLSSVSLSEEGPKNRETKSNPSTQSNTLKRREGTSRLRAAPPNCKRAGRRQSLVQFELSKRTRRMTSWKCTWETRARQSSSSGFVTIPEDINAAQEKDLCQSRYLSARMNILPKATFTFKYTGGASIKGPLVKSSE